MGYTTEFKGKLVFTKELTASQLAVIQSICGEDCRDHPEWNSPDLHYVDLKLTDDFSGIQWNGAEKTYSMVELVNLIIGQMRDKWPDFGLSGELAAQGEDVEDRWTLAIDQDGWATKRPVVIVGEKITCPHCERKFILEKV